MKTQFYTKTLFIALVVAVAANISPAQSPSSPPPADGALPPNVQPGSPLAEVIKLVQAGVEAGTIRSYIANTPGVFGLDAGMIVYLNDAGVPTDNVNAMMEHDKNISVPVAASAPAAAPVAAPAPEVTVNQFYENLSPYGSWVEVEGYGRCWRPTTVIYDSAWQPYCDRGHWVYSDYGWYWDSDYLWGVTFHYGRWFHHSRMGWCWWPDTVWAPSWVTWRSNNDYCGWAPLPPFAVYRPGVGFFYRGAGVAVGFDFGLGAECFTFVSMNRFSERHPRYYRAEQERGRQIFNQTTIINNYNVHNRTIVNGGIPVEHINAGVHRPIQPVPIAQIPHAERQGWRGTGADYTQHSGTTSPTDHRDRNISPGNTPTRNSPIPTIQNNNPRPTPSGPVSGQSGNRDNPNRNLNTPSDTHQNVTPPASNYPRPSQSGVTPVRPPTSPQPDTHSGNRDIPSRTVNTPTDTHQNVTPPAGYNSRPSQSSMTRVPSPETHQRIQTPQVEAPPHNSAPATPPANNWQQNRQSQAQTPPVVSTPRLATSSTPPPAASSQPQYQNRNANQYSDRDKQSR